MFFISFSSINSTRVTIWPFVSTSEHLQKPHSGNTIRPANTGVPQGRMSLLARRNNTSLAVFRGIPYLDFFVY